MAGIAGDRAAAVRWVLARFREQAEYEQVRGVVNAVISLAWQDDGRPLTG
jgi:hypothetical protein